VHVTRTTLGLAASGGLLGGEHLRGEREQQEGDE